MMRAIGIPTEMFTVMFAIGRMPGWIANFKEILDGHRKRICRPRQIYIGPRKAQYSDARGSGLILHGSSLCRGKTVQ